VGGSYIVSRQLDWNRRPSVPTLDQETPGWVQKPAFGSSQEGQCPR
jgi:hypothetical protein